MRFSLPLLGVALLGAATTMVKALTFSAVYAQGDNGNGIGGYDVRSTADRAFAFDYDHSGKLDHIVLYRPGTGTLWIQKKNPDGTFTPVYAQGDPGLGIGGYDLRSTADRAFAFDYDHSGKLDHIVLYRPGTGTLWILKHNADDSWAPVYAQGDPGNGIAGYDLKSPNDLVFAFDYAHTGRLDYLVLYRPGTGTIWIVEHEGDGSFKAVYAQGDPGSGIGGYNLLSLADRAFAYDFDRSGRKDYLALYRPGTGTIWILNHLGDTWQAVYAQGDPGSGIGGYDLRSTADQVFAFDIEGSGKIDDLALYRPGTGTFWALTNSYGVFTAQYHQGDPGNGVGGYDLKSSVDQAFAFDYESSGKLNYVALYRPGRGAFWIAKANP